MTKVTTDSEINMFMSTTLVSMQNIDSLSISNYVELLSMVSIKSQIQVNYIIERNKSDVKSFVRLPSPMIWSNSFLL